MRGPDQHGMQSNVTLEVTSADEATSRGFLEEIRALATELNVFRGQVITFAQGDEFDHHGLGPIVFLERPEMTSDQLILPEGAMSSIEAQVFGIARHRERLLASGQHLKRGLLLHGPPGTGKTLTVSYLISQLREHTVVVLSGFGLHMVKGACSLARLLEPSVVILEDVDLVAEERGRFGPHSNPILFEVLNQMEGLEEDADVAELLGKLLKADRFPEWLVAEALALLAVDASEILRQLTGGQFSLAVGEKEFVVIDHGNADERRPARTLSGGETFQASLALALALSQQIRNLAAEGAPRLDAIFLDEGFGSLDPDTLDVVAATIENLGQSGRMVGVVTHVRELASRVPVRFEVSKGRGTSVVEKRFA
jgi:DNA polymerase III delta prime subunit